MTKGDDRATVGASGKLDKEMKLESGVKQVAKAIGNPYRGEKGRFASKHGGMKFRIP
jgi:hypothetical protein